MIEQETASGNRKSWSKIVTGIDETKNNGYSVIGDFLKEDTELDLPEGALVVQCIPDGSVKHGGKHARLFKVTADGLIEVAYCPDWYKFFLSFRDDIKRELGQKENPLEKFSDDELVAELCRRGVGLK